MRLWSRNIAWGVFLSAAFICGANVQASVLHTFDTSGQVAGYSKAPGSDASSTVTWQATGGNPGGYLRYTEATTGGEDRLALPNAFLGDKSGYYGGEFSFDHRLTGGTSYANTRLNDVEFVGGGFNLIYDLATPTLNTWLSHVLPLDDTGAWVHAGSLVPATASEILTTLSDLTAIYLHADFRLGTTEVSHFDNIRMVPEPTTWGLAALGLLGLGLLRRLRR